MRIRIGPLVTLVLIGGLRSIAAMFAGYYACETDTKQHHEHK
jgi:hypothetical protein